MDVLVKTIERYDILLIQEIRDSSGEAIVQLLNQVNNQTEHPFSMNICARLGRTSSKEQYAYFYRPDSGLTVTKDYLYDDGDESQNTENVTVDTFEREPYALAFSSSKTVLKEFALVGVHIAPGSVVDELNELENVIADVQSLEIMGIDDVMIMGDMNADCNYFPEKYWDDVRLKNDTAKYQWLIPDDADTTVADSASFGDCAYDRFISTGSGFLATYEGGVVPNSASVFRFDMEYGLTAEETKAVSDHYPIEFRLKMEPSETTPATTASVPSTSSTNTATTTSTATATPTTAAATATTTTATTTGTSPTVYANCRRFLTLVSTIVCMLFL